MEAEQPGIIVGYDGSDESRDALALARTLSSAMGAELILVSALTFAPPEVGVAAYERALRADGERLAAEIREQLGDAPVRTLAVPAASAARTLHDAAEGENAALIVLGSTHRGPLGRVLPGSVGERLLAAGPCAVAVAPRGFAAVDHPGVGLIGVGWSSAPESEQALLFAASLAGRIGCRLRALSVVEPTIRVAPIPPDATAGWASIEQAFESAEEPTIEERERQLATALGHLPDEVDAEPELLTGDPEAQLLDASADLDLLVLGSRGYGPVKRVLLGGVSAPLMRKAACPVIVVPRASGPQAMPGS